MHKKHIFDISFRYILLVLIALGNLKLFYFIFKPLTVYPVYFTLKILYGGVLIGADTIFFKGYYAQIIPACVAGAAYYFLLMLNLTTPMHLKKRIYSLLFILGGFLILNIVRILIFSKLMFVGYQYFDITHKLSWYFGSTIVVVVLWFISVHLFKIKDIPVITDVKTIAKDLKLEAEDKHEY